MLLDTHGYQHRKRNMTRSQCQYEILRERATDMIRKAPPETCRAELARRGDPTRGDMPTPAASARRTMDG
jgi:hypothetical protein